MIESNSTSQSRGKPTNPQSICRWCYPNLSLDELCTLAVSIGYRGIDLVGPQDFSTLKKYGLVGTMTPTHSIERGLADPANHAECLGLIEDAIAATADAGFPNVICFSGNRNGMDPREGMQHCAKAIKSVAGIAERRGVKLCMELLNSKVDHPDYLCDHTTWGVELVKAVGSERFKLLYDVYHMQIMEGDIIATIRKHGKHFGHYHTGGVPGRHEIDHTQELNYQLIMKAIAEVNPETWVAQEFLPTRDPATVLTEAFKACGG